MIGLKQIQVIQEKTFTATDDGWTKKKSCRKKSRLLKINKKTGTHSARINYVQYKNVLKQASSHEEKNHYENQLTTKANDSRMTWKLTNTLLNKNNTEKTDIFNTHNNFTNNCDIVLNYQFCVELRPNLAKNIKPRTTNFNNYNAPTIRDSLAITSCTDPYEIKDIIPNIKNSKSCGVDQIPITVIKSVSKCSSPIFGFTDQSPNSNRYLPRCT